MSLFNYPNATRRFSLTAMILIAFLLNAGAQTLSLVITPPSGPSGDYQIGVNGLHANDLVYYRFSDAVDLSAQNSFSNPQATVSRKFQLANERVSAYVARKNGPIELVTGDISNQSCNCSPTPPASSGVFIRPSWSPSVHDMGPLVDDKTVPQCNLPTDPWFFMGVTISAPNPNSYVEIDIPANMTIAGAIVRSSWTAIPGVGSYPVSDPDVESIAYNAFGRVRIGMTGTVGLNTIVTVYLVVTCNTELGEQSSFSAQLYDYNRKKIGSTSLVRTTTHTNPHDPNVLAALQTGTCLLTQDTPPLTYRVDFQNLGAGSAKGVKVRFEVNPSIINLSAPMIAVTSHPGAFSGIYVGSNYIDVVFYNIYLPGTGEQPVPSLESTKGWVELTVLPKPCLNFLTNIFVTRSYVTFYGATGFVETIPTNSVTQGLTHKCEPDAYCFQDPTNGGGIGGFEGSDPEKIFAPSCYPSLFQDILHLEAPQSDENGSLDVQISDLTGRVWGKAVFPTLAGVDTRETLETSSFPPGMYIVDIKSGKNTAVFKVIKE